MRSWTVVMLLDHEGGVVLGQYQVTAEDVDDAVWEAWQIICEHEIPTSSWPAPDVLDILVFEGMPKDYARGRLGELKYAMTRPR